MTLGKLIVFEGLNGCGKGTQLQKLHNYLSSSGKAVPIFTTGEPNNFDDNGIKAREMLKRDSGNPYENGIEAVKYFAKNRLEHNKIFKPLLEKGIDVLCDRYYHSNFAYQHAQGIPYEEIAKANENVIRPDLTLILNTIPEESLKRLKLRDGDKGRKFDSDLEFNKKVWNNYFGLCNAVSKLMKDNSIRYIHGMKAPEEVFEQIKLVYNNFLSKLPGI